MAMSSWCLGAQTVLPGLDARSLEMVARVAVEINNCSFRLFYDCPAAGTSHLYFQACYFPSPYLWSSHLLILFS
ncbi:hypothetical protein SLA2020_421430 [Shorea laevis]